MTTSNNHTLSFSGKLLGTFSDVYQRSNKSSGRKNLRCFPRCRGGVHRRSTFCGDVIEAQIMYSKVSSHNDDDVDIDNLIVLGEFTSVGGTADLNSPSLGDFTSTKKIQEKIKHDAWFPSLVLKQEEVARDTDLAISATIVFSVAKSWHYGWTSNRHYSRECQHTFKLFALAPLRSTGGAAYTCIGAYSDGPKFLVVSTRRSPSPQTPAAGSSPTPPTPPSEAPPSATAPSIGVCPPMIEETPADHGNDPEGEMLWSSSRPPSGGGDDAHIGWGEQDQEECCALLLGSCPHDSSGAQ